MPLNLENTELIVAHTLSGAEALAARIPQARLVVAFQAVLSEVFYDIFQGRHEARRPSLVYCGDDTASKAVAAQLMHDVGFDPLDAGPLRIARYIEPFAMLIGQPAYESTKKPELSYRFE